MKKFRDYYGRILLRFLPKKTIRVMKLTLFLCMMTIFQLFATETHSQMTKLTLKLEDVKISDALKEIENQSEFFFLYSPKLIDVEKKVDVDAKKESIKDILSDIFDEKVKFTVYDRQIIISPGDMTALSDALQQQQKVTGTVTDKTGAPLPGVNVVVTGITQGTITDIAGKYSIDIPQGAKSLTFSFIGMEPQEISIGTLTQINVTMVESAIGLDEVVVIGYGTQKKVNLTGSVVTIDASSLENRPVTNVSTALQGLVTGATIIQNSGQPGKDMASIRIRGIGTLNNANPMYVVDGMVVQSVDDIDPNDIESISILKDAASASIYGSRASNGVVLLTTKKGSNKVATLKYDAYFGWQKPIGLVENLPSWEFAQQYNQGRINIGQSAIYSAQEIEKFKNGSDPDNYPNTDWIGMFYKNGFQQSHRAELSGGSENTTYLFSLGYFDQGGIFDHANFKRYNARTNITTKFNKITVGLNLAFTYGNTTEPINSWSGDLYQIIHQIHSLAPFVPYKYSNGYYGYSLNGNPLAWMDLGSIRNEQYRKTHGIGNIAYEPIKGLKLQEIVGYEFTGSSDETFVKDIQYYNWKTGDPTLYQGPNYQTDTRQDYQMISLQTLVTYNKTFGRHTIGALAGFSQEYSRTDWNSSYRKGFLSNELWEINAGSPDGQAAGGSAYELALRSYFGRISYDFDNKYLLEANIRYDGTSRLAKSHQWGAFPSFSAGWRIINEPFMENLKNVVSDLKIRAGWGILGNQNIGVYPFQSVLSAANYDFGGKVNQGVALTTGFNKNIKWESSKTTNIGVDLGLFSNQFTLSTDVYQRITYDILTVLPLPITFGLAPPYQNAGEVVNKGIEFQLGYNLTRGDWKFDILVNASYNKNEISNLKNNGIRIWQSDGCSFLQEGYPIDSYGGYVAEGLFRTLEDLNSSAVIDRTQAGLGDIKYKDLNNDGIINAEDREFLGSWVPKWIFGSTLGASWKGFDIQLFFQGAAKFKKYYTYSTLTTMFRDYYDKDTNPNGSFPRPLAGWPLNDCLKYPSSFWIVNGSYLRLKNMQVGYTIPARVYKFVGISKAKIYYSGQNLLTFSVLRKGWDPEAPKYGSSYYSQVQTNTFGLSITF